MKSIKTVISGIGRIGWQFHIPAMAAHAGFNLTGACDPVKERRAEAEETFGLNTYEGYEEMLTAEKPELAIIASPTHLHKEQAIYAMEHGCDVFLDKPMARDINEAEEIAAVMARTSRKLMMYQPRRGDATTQVIKRVIQSGRIGEVFMIKCNWSAYVFRNDWQAFKKYGGGMLNNFGAHAIDAALYLAGTGDASAEVKKQHGYMNKIASAGDADDVVKILIETNNRIAVDIDINMASAYTGIPSLIVYGRYGVIYQDSVYSGNPCRVRCFDPALQPEITASDSLAAADRQYINNPPKNWVEEDIPLLPQDAVDYYAKCYDYFVMDGPPFVPVAETLTVMRVIDACHRQAGWTQ